MYHHRLNSIEWLRKGLYETNRDFWLGHQVDNSEALHYLLVFLGLSENDNGNFDYEIQQQERVTCRDCKFEFNKRYQDDIGDNFLHLSMVNFKGISDVKGLLAKMPQLKDYKKAVCPKCKKNLFSNHSRQITKTGSILILDLNWYDDSRS